jgi:hypothetical protein
MPTPERLPYYAGPNDASLLRDYLNIIIRALNELLQYIGTIVTPTFPIMVDQGGTGADNAVDARANLGAAASGDNQDITALSGLIYRSTAADTTVLIGDQTIEVDASAGDVTITYPLALVGAGIAKTVRVLKIDATGNLVLISNGTSAVDAITTPASADGQVGGWRDIYSSGTALRCMGVG